MRNPYDSLKCWQQVMLREMRRIISRPIYAYCIVGMPLFCLVFFTTLMYKGLPDKMPAAVVDQDRSALSRNVIRTLQARQEVEITRICTSCTEAREAMQRGEIYGFLHIPKNFSRDLQSNRQPALTYYTSYMTLIPGSLLYSGMRETTELVAGAAGRSQLIARGATEDQAMAYLRPIVVENHALHNPALNYSIYLTNLILPGILMLLISLMTVYSIGSEVKDNTARHWLESSNHSILIALLAKLLPYTILYFLVACTNSFVLHVLLEYPNSGGLLPTLLLNLCMVISAQALGLVFFSLIPTLRMALSITSLWGVVSFSICGMSYPYAAMAGPVKALSNLFPLRHYYLVYTSQTLAGNSPAYAWLPYTCLLATVLLALALFVRLKRNLIHSSYIP